MKKKLQSECLAKSTSNLVIETSSDSTGQLRRPENKMQPQQQVQRFLAVS